MKIRPFCFDLTFMFYSKSSPDLKVVYYTTDMKNNGVKLIARTLEKEAEGNLIDLRGGKLKHWDCEEVTECSNVCAKQGHHSVGSLTSSLIRANADIDEAALDLLQQRVQPEEKTDAATKTPLPITRPADVHWANSSPGRYGKQHNERELRRSTRQCKAGVYREPPPEWDVDNEALPEQYIVYTHDGKRKRSKGHVNQQDATKRACLGLCASTDNDDDEVLPPNFGLLKKETMGIKQETDVKSELISSSTTATRLLQSSAHPNAAGTTFHKSTQLATPSQKSVDRTSDNQDYGAKTQKPSAPQGGAHGSAGQPPQDVQAIRDRLKMIKLEKEELELNRQLREMGY